MTSDVLSPLRTLTAAERSRAREIARSNPQALWPAIVAALHVEGGEATLDRMDTLLREVRSCST